MLRRFIWLYHLSPLAPAKTILSQTVSKDLKSFGEAGGGGGSGGSNIRYLPPPRVDGSNLHQFACWYCTDGNGKRCSELDEEAQALLITYTQQQQQKKGGGESRAKYFLEHNWAKLTDSKNTTTKLSGWWASQQWEAQRKLTETWKQKTMGIPLELWNHPNRHPTPHYVLFGGLCVPNAILLP